MTRIILLGVGTGLPDSDRENTHMVWDGPGGPLLIDAGGSTYQRLLRVGINPLDLRGVLLTHSHADHINGLPVLLFSLALAGRQEPLPIYGLEATLTLVQEIIDAFMLETVVAPVIWYPLRVTDIPLSILELDTSWSLAATLNQHSRPCLALRFESYATDQALVYSGDTAPCRSVAELARNASILLHEATVAEPSDSHTTPQQAGAVAAQAHAGRLVLVHFSPCWTMPEEQALAAIRAGGFAGPAEIGQEFQVLEF